MDEQLQKLPGEAYSKNIRARFWITGKKPGYIGIGRIELLEKIHQLGSMSKAAKSMGMSYKKAWKLIEELNGMYEEPLIVKVKGGKAGGGSELTEKGKAVIAEFKRIEQRITVLLEELSESID
ncbi:hypothetical protein JCM30760_20550 [Thiomicrorhabdus hydrogeniphila]